MEIASTNSSLWMSTPEESNALDTLSVVMGWLYFASWSVCYYPQIRENWKRKSVVGYDFNFLALETVDMTFYTLFNIGLFAFPSIQKEYMKDHDTNVIPVQVQDVLFSAHGVICCILIIVQSRLYERGGQIVSTAAKLFICAIFLFAICSIIATLDKALDWAQFLGLLSYVKIMTTLKYIPQMLLNYKRGSTDGFSIGLVLLDLAGGVFSISQMMVISYNANDWTSITGDPTKLIIGVLSIVFGFVLAFQHYVCFRNTNPPMILHESTEEQPEDDEEVEKNEEV